MDRETEDRLLARLADSRFHRVFHLPPNPAKGRTKPFRVTYADIGREACLDEEEEARKPVVWFCGGMMAGRWIGASADPVLTARGVRLITIDRPGMGGTHRCPVKERLDIYMEIVPALLSHLKIRHITLAANSGGVIYAFNIILHYRHLLHPRHPTLAMFAPWVHQSHTDATAMAITDWIPRAGIANFHNALTFISKRVNPVIGFSSGMVARILPSDDKPALGTEPPAAEGEGLQQGGSEARESGDRIHMTEEERKMEKHRFPLIFKYLLAEDLSGVSDEALFLLKRTGDRDPWGSWGDFDTCVPLIAKQEVERRQRLGSDGKPLKVVRFEELLKVQVFYAENDRMTGRKGWKWFEECWSEEKRGGPGVIEYESYTWPKTTHDEILDRKLGLLDKWISDVARMHEQD